MPQTIINCKNLKKANVVLIAVPFDGTSSFAKGSDGAPPAIRDVLDSQIEIVNTLTGTNPTDLKIHWADLNLTAEFDLMKPEEMVQHVGDFYHNLDLRQFPLMIGGEHSITFPALRALCRSHGPEKICVVQIDTHLDLRDTDADYNDEPHGKFAHSCVMRRVMELGCSVMAVGIRDFSETFEVSFLSKKKFGDMHTEYRWPSTFTPHQIALDIPPDSLVYVTIDVDGMDPSDMPATGTPVSGGPSLDFVRNLLEEIYAKHRVIGADIVEVIARKNWRENHTEVLTVRNAAQLAYDIIALHQQSSQHQPRPRIQITKTHRKAKAGKKAKASKKRRV